MFTRSMLCSLVATSCFFAQTSHAGANDDALIRAIPLQIAEGWNRADGDAVASVYADDGVLVAGHGVVTRGRERIASYHDDLFATTNKGTKLTVEVRSVRFLDPDTAIVQTEGGILWPGETTLAPRNRGIQSFVVVKQAAGWRVVLFQNTRIQVGD